MIEKIVFWTGAPLLAFAIFDVTASCIRTDMYPKAATEYCQKHLIDHLEPIITTRLFCVPDEEKK